jgi:hypothetical protein
MTSAPESAHLRKALRLRVFWFIAGSGVNYLLTSTPFKWLRAHTALSLGASSAIAMATSTLFFFCWNYFVNFRTDARKRDALPRYVAAVALMWVLSSTLLTLLKHYNAHMSFAIGRFPLDLDIISTQLFLAWLKFLLYHKWAFPVKATSRRPGAD